MQCKWEEWPAWVFTFSATTQMSSLKSNGQPVGRRGRGDHNQNSRIDYGQLISVCAQGRAVTQANLYGSVPPDNDSLWRAIRAHGWKVKTLERNYAGKEKGLDIEIALDMIVAITR
jgi:hypothetical protein